MMEKLKGLIVEEQGQGMTEYGLVLGVIAVAVVVTLGLLKDEIQAMYTEVVTSIQNR